MKHIFMACVALAGCLTLAAAHAAGRLAEVALIDRDSGSRLEAYFYRGEYWVAGEPGARYAIYISNRLGERLLAVTSVDGVNVISGQTAGWDQGGYVLDPGEDYQITGWRKSDYQVAAFAFTPAPRSYAARTGRSDNVGVIGVALFREQPLAYALPPRLPESSAAARAQERERPQEHAPEASAPSGSADLAANSRSLAIPAPALGTAHGMRESSYVAHTTFMRRQSRPDEVIRIRYDRLDNLVALGIIPRRPLPAPRPNPFPESFAPSYVPDPPSVSDRGLVP